jgi:hypothetical protein
LRTLVERESLVEVAELLQGYLDGGAPLGNARAAEEVLKQIRPASR